MCIVIVAKDKTFTLRCKNEDDQAQWYSDIHSNIALLKGIGNESTKSPATSSTKAKSRDEDRSSHTPHKSAKKKKNREDHHMKPGVEDLQTPSLVPKAALEHICVVDLLNQDGGPIADTASNTPSATEATKSATITNTFNFHYWDHFFAAANPKDLPPPYHAQDEIDIHYAWVRRLVGINERGFSCWKETCMMPVRNKALYFCQSLRKGEVVDLIPIDLITHVERIRLSTDVLQDLCPSSCPLSHKLYPVRQRECQVGPPLTSPEMIGGHALCLHLDRIMRPTGHLVVLLFRTSEEAVEWAGTVENLIATLHPHSNLHPSIRASIPPPRGDLFDRTALIATCRRISLEKIPRNSSWDVTGLSAASFVAVLFCSILAQALF
eukprot:TRINITY_DN8189_c0_g3_i5.p1 TRINITY_DN8189_c0_g3~~TRINITY_DN8189_c0_g3_i5.p1  ORF type:complete len:380 (-),score=71.52 TRINITY_DN8189_c0_g3_i5:316-1455(-)